MPARALPRRAAFAALAALALGGCPKSPGKPADGSGASSECRVRLADTPFTARPAEPLPARRSRIGVEVQAELAALERALGREVPVTLAAERRKPVGAPGEVSYVVRRGRIGVGLDAERLTVKVPVEVEAEVCKPLGPFCPTYGRCSPRLAAVASVPLLLNEGYEVGKSRVSIAVTSPCTIAGIDATPQIRSQAARQVGNVQGRIDASMPDIRPSVAGVWELLHHPIALGTTTCLRIAPDRITQHRPKLENGTLISRLGAEGTLRIQDPCEPTAAVKPPPLPKLTTSDDAGGGIELVVPIRASWLDVSAQLTRSLAPVAGETRVVKVEAEGTSAGERALVALRATLGGATCGDLRLLGEPWFDAKEGRVRLRRLRPLPGAPDLPELAELAAKIERHASATLPVDIASGPAALTALVQGFEKDLPEGVEIHTQMRPSAVERVHPERDGLVALAIFAGHTTFRVR